MPSFLAEEGFTCSGTISYRCNDERFQNGHVFQRAGRLRDKFIDGEHGQRVFVEREVGLPAGRGGPCGPARKLRLPEGRGPVLRPDAGVLPDTRHRA